MAKKKSADKKKRWRWACLGLAIVSVIALAYRYLPAWFAILSVKAEQSASIGIIGGADGPTAIFVSTRFGYFPTGIYLVLLVMGIIGFFALRNIKDE